MAIEKKSKVAQVRMDSDFFKVVSESYCEPLGISFSEAVRQALKDSLAMQGIDWRKAVMKIHAGG